MDRNVEKAGIRGQGNVCEAHWNEGRAGTEEKQQRNALLLVNNNGW